MNVVAALRNCGLFSGLADADLRRLAAIARCRSFAAGAALFAEGEAADRFYVVASGRVKVFTGGEGGREQILHVVHAGESFAEAAVFGGGRFPAAAETLEASELVAIPAAPFLALLRGDPELSLQVVAGLTRWLRRLVDLVNDLALRDVPARLAAFLLREASARHVDAAAGARIPLGTSKGVLARRLGTAAETLSRALYKLQQEGAIRVEGREVLVLDGRRLKKLAGN